MFCREHLRMPQELEVKKLLPEKADLQPRERGKQACRQLLEPLMDRQAYRWTPLLHYSVKYRSIGKYKSIPSHTLTY